MSTTKQVVAVDPGLTACGVAVLNQHGFVHAAALVLNEHGPGTDLPQRWQGMALAVGAYVARCSSYLEAIDRSLVVEMPRIYPGPRQKGDQNDLVNLAGVVASIVMLGCADRQRIIYPRDWKGTLDPDAMIDRIAGKVQPDGSRKGGRLFPKEHENVRLPTAAGLQHNVYDAIGIGLHVVGRLEDRMVVPR